MKSIWAGCDQLSFGQRSLVTITASSPLCTTITNQMRRLVLFPVWQENGWYAQTGSVKAKKFLKQDKEVLSKVWSLIYASIVPVNHPPVDGPEKLTDAEYEQLYRNEKYDGICCLSNKRFLLEINLATNSVYHIEPLLVFDKELPTDSDFLATRYFIDEDHSRPWFYKEFAINNPDMRCETAEWF